MRSLAALLVLLTFAVAASPAAAARQDADIVDTATAAGDFTTLTKLLKRAGLVSALRQSGPFTVFAPTDAAFAKVPKATLAALGKNKAQLKAVLLYHVVKGKVTAAQAEMLTSATTLQGAALPIRATGGKVFVGGAQVVKADVMASNGVIHVINKVLLPPKK